MFLRVLMAKLLKSNLIRVYSIALLFKTKFDIFYAFILYNLTDLQLYFVKKIM